MLDDAPGGRATTGGFLSPQQTWPEATDRQVVRITAFETLVKEFDPVFDATDLANLPNFNVYLKLMVDGKITAPFSARTLEPIGSAESRFTPGM